MVIVLIILRMYKFYFKSNKETFESLPIVKECRDITPKKLLAIFNNDKEKLTNVLIEHGVPIDLITNKSSYPVIATYLLSKGVITKCD